MEKRQDIQELTLEEVMGDRFGRYSKYIIQERALPDIRDGLKPVQRRILFSMNKDGNTFEKSFRKSAKSVGNIMGNYHPHGDSSIYEAMVRLSQDWKLREVLIEMHGNNGSMDGDPPAAMRYTEARLSELSGELLKDIEKETVAFQLNFDDTLYEPKVMPTRVPTLLVNGATGIAVGMATNMPPHNLTEVINGTLAYLDNNDIEVDELMTHIKAPDFPTGGVIYGYEGVREAFKTGRGRIVMRAKVGFEEVDGRECIIVTEIPYQVNKAEMIKRTADLVNDKKIEGIANIRDESDRNGMRIVYILKRDATPNVVLNTLYKFTSLQSSFSVNNIALVKGRPQMLNLKDMIHYFIEHRHDVVVRRTQFELRKAEERAHILEGLIIASDNIDEVIAIIRGSKNTEEAREKLIERFKLSDIQARAIVEMRLRQLTGLEQDKLRAEFEELMKLIEHLKALLADVNLRTNLIKEELEEIREKYGDERRSKIEYSGGDVSIEDLIADENVVITISHAGYIKRTNLTEYKTQNRGGVGQKSAGTRDQDFLEHMFVATNHQYMMFFTQKGKCFWMRVYEIPEGSKTAKGRAIQNLVNIESDDKVKAFICTQDLKDKDYINSHNLVMVTKQGQVKKTSLEKYSKPRVNGVAAITIKEGDELMGAQLTDGESQIILAVKSGKLVRFEETKTRPMGRTASGVRGITLKDDTDEVIGMVTVGKNDVNDSQILVVTENGYGKRTKLVDEDGEDVYRITNRGGKGVKTLNITEKTGKLISINAVTDADDLMIINKSGLTIRMAIEDLRVMGRATQGVRLINLKGKDSIAAVTKVMKDDVEEVVVDEDGNVIESVIERVKPDLEVLEDEGPVEDDDDSDDEVIDDEGEDADEEESEE